MWSQRLWAIVGLTMMGDGLMALLYPRRYMAFWRAGPPAWREAVELLRDHPEMVRALGATEFGLGLWLASRQLPEHG